MKFDRFIQAVSALKNVVDKLYVYGAGFYGKDICRVLLNNNVLVDGFVVTKPMEIDTVMELPVLVVSEVNKYNSGIVIGVSDTYIDAVLTHLQEINFNMRHVLNGGKYITKTGGREDLRDSKVLEVSTIMGCKVNCHYCPQSLFLRRYFENNPNRQRVMTLENFQTILNHTPPDCIIDFSGMTEPFDNPHCLEMIRMACDAGRKVYLFSTLARVDEKTVDQLLKLPIYYMTLHVADRKGYAVIPLTETYYRNIQKVTEAKKADGSPFVDFINAQAEPDERVADIVRSKYEVMCSVQSRAGNVKDKTAQHRESMIRPGKKIKCCFCGDELSNNVVLPDGTLLLCNMDYGLNHVLGNLYLEDYDIIRSKGELRRILSDMDCGSDMNLLCRNCLLARVVD